MRSRIPAQVLSLFSLTSICSADAVLYVVPAPPGPGSTPRLEYLSSDGTAAAGSYSSGGLRIMRWTIADGSEALTVRADGGGEGLGCSGAGDVLTGFAGLHSGLTGYRWTPADGWIVMPMPPDTWYTVPVVISEDGLAIACWVVGTGGYARTARWTETLGYEILHDVPTDNAFPQTMSADGSTVVGTTMNRPFFWHRSNGFTLIPAGNSVELRFGVSFDGQYIVGSDPQSIWLFDRTTQTLERLDSSGGGALQGKPRGVSGDGSIVVGGTSAGAFIWDAKHGGRDLATVLSTEHNLDLTGWQLDQAIGISADGNVIAGNGRLNGVSTSWVIALHPPVPYQGRPPCQGDVDGDHRVTISDLTLVLSGFRLPDTSGAIDCTGDGVVDARDVDVVMHDLGDRCDRRPALKLP